MMYSLLFNSKSIFRTPETAQNTDINITHELRVPHWASDLVTIYSCFRIIASLIAAVTLPRVLYRPSPRFPPLVMNCSPSPATPVATSLSRAHDNSNTPDGQRHSDLHIYLNRPLTPTESSRRLGAGDAMRAPSITRPARVSPCLALVTNEAK